jgi:exopolysaccharide biosynthesis operon protein EpsL
VRRRRLAVLCGLACAAAGAQPVLAQTLLPQMPGPLPTEYQEIRELDDESPRRFWLGAGIDIARDDNVFRLPEGSSTAAVGAAGRTNSSTITRAYGQVNADVNVGAQRLLAQFSLSDYRFSGLSYLDYVSPEFRGSWRWRLGSNWSGEVNYNHLKLMASFLDTRPIAQNLQTLDYLNATGEYAISPRWRIGGGLIGYTAKNSADFARAGNSQQITEEIGLKYMTTERYYVRGFASASQGSYPNRTASATFDDEYSQTDAGIDVLYGVSDISSLRGRVGYTSRSYPNVKQRDFSGATGRLDFVWGLSPKTALDFNVRRELGVFEVADASYYVTTAAGVAARWEFLPRFRLEAGYERWWREYLGEPAAVAGTVVQRKDELDFIRAGVTWNATRNWFARLGVQRSTRDSNRNDFDFKRDTVIFGTVQFGF